MSMTGPFESPFNSGTTGNIGTPLGGARPAAVDQRLSDTPPSAAGLDRLPPHVGVSLDAASTAGWPTPDLTGSVGLLLRNNETASWFGWLQLRPQWTAPNRFDVVSVTVGLAVAVYAPTLARTYVAAADLTFQASPGGDPNAPPADQRWDTSITDGALSDYGALFAPRGDVATSWRFTQDVPAADLLNAIFAETPPVGQIVWVSSNPRLVHPL
jgi:hypothetical protein